MSSLAQNIIDKIRQVTNLKDESKIPLHEPCFKGNELKYTQDCITSGWVSSVGSYVDSFEKDLADFLGAKHAIAVVNGTAALHLCLVVAGIEPEDEVLVPAMTFVATANSVSYQRAIPHFVDVCERTLGICPVKLDNHLSKVADIQNGICINRKTRRKIKAIIPMHTFGHTVDMDALNLVAQKYNITVIEDAAESLGSLYKGKHAGTLSSMAAISFNGNKIITTGGGGAVITGDEDLAKKLKHLSTTARIYDGYKFSHNEIGYNYRMPNINAAIGHAQLEMLPELVSGKRDLALKYKEAFANLDGISFISEPEHCTSNYWLNTLRLHDSDMLTDVLNSTNKAGIMTRPVWELMPDLPMYKDAPCSDIASARLLKKSLINIPSSYFLVN